ncbi:MAG: 6-phosphofructokinase [Saprospirales bacterium]|nr:6-phosphofructokinase [Saprospirales bacterium]MBK8489982.1 6-phosphofructokinase [Saprospirales bacterium]
MQRIAVFTSGGDAPGMNACIRAVVRTAIALGKEVYGIRRGYAGLIEEDLFRMEKHTVSNIIQLGGTILQSARSTEFLKPEGRRKAYEVLKKYGIEGIVAIGGDGTFRGARVFMEEYPDIAIVGIPGTIDNDLYGTDFTIGYDTAINTAMNAIDNIKDTANAHNRLFFIEVMGRDAGFIALRSAIATGAEAVLIPEEKTDMDELIRMLEYNYHHKKRASIVVVAEGDDAGGAFQIADQVKARCPQFDIRCTVLGHVQRGGRPTCMERVLASRLGMEGVRALLAGTKSVMVGEVHRQIVFTPFEQATKHHQKINPVLIEMVELLA